LSVLLLLPALARAQEPSDKELRDGAAAAYKAKDYAAFLARSKALVERNPKSLRSAYNLACAEALTGDPKSAARRLVSIVERGLDLSPDVDDDLASLRATPDWEPVRTKLEALRAPISNGRVAFTLPEVDQIPEGIAYDPVTRTHFVSSVHKRKIVARAADGSVSDFVASGQDGLFAALGIALDAKRRLLWVASAALPEMTGYEKAFEGASGLFAFDLSTRKLARKVLFPKDGKRHALGDVAVSPSGDVYASDGMNGGVYRLAARKDELAELVAPGILRSAQGMGFWRNGKTLLVADWAGGITAVDVTTGQRRALTALDEVPLLGIDGLAVHGDSLVVTQNGIKPHRVTRLFLDGTTVTKAVVLERASAHFDEPTLGTIVGDEYLFVANSQWGAFDKDGKLPPPGKLKGPVILALRLK